MAGDDPFADLGETLEDEPQDTDDSSEPETAERPRLRTRSSRGTR
jgi:hypothetical protein